MLAAAAAPESLGGGALAGPAAAALAGQLLSTFAAAGIDTHLTVQIPLPQMALPDEAPSAGDPVALVHTFAAALCEAEHVLGPQHLAVAGGSLDAVLALPGADGSAATARLALHIAPRSHS